MTERVIRPGARYARSIHLERDYSENGFGLTGYQVTPLVVQTIKRISAGLDLTSTARAYSLVGPYGAGKSAFGVFLAHYLSHSAHDRATLLAEHGYANAPPTATQSEPALLPLLISGNNSSLRVAIVQGVDRISTSLPEPQADAMKLVVRQALAGDQLDPQMVTDLVVRMTQLVREYTAYNGIALIIDELGQYLNYTARHSDERDLFVLQTLAEMAARSRDVPCLIVTILHQTFDRYATNAGATQRLEWAKVQGRFIEIPFQEPTSQMMRMLGHALCPVEQLDAQRLAWAAHVAPVADVLGLRPSDVSPADWRQLVAQTYPLHPTVVAVLPLLFRQLAQNERSLFSFLYSPEPGSLADALDATPRNTQPVTYRLPQLYEYVEATMGASLFGRARGQRWAELAEARALLAAEPPIIGDTLTTIGTLGALGQQRGVRASSDLVAFALQDHVDAPDVIEALDWLVQHRRIIYRKHRNSFLLWEGSDLDLEGLIQQGRREIVAHTSLVDLLNEHAPQLPFVARRFSYETGTIRAFAPRFVSISDLAALPSIASSYDGEVVLVVPADNEEVQHAKAWATATQRAETPNQLVVVPYEVAFLRDVLLDVATLQHVSTTTPQLEHDRVARRELQSRLVETQQAVDEAVRKTYGLRFSQWFWRSQQRRVQTARHLDGLLSDVCHATFPATPRVWNELIVRQHLSTAAAKARRVLIEAMLDHEHEENLGLVGFPPERSIYESVLRRSGIHRQDPDGVWRFGPPSQDDPLSLQAVWNAVDDFFSQSESKVSPLEILYSLLEAPPYGVRAGLSPLIFVAAYLANAGEIALYEHGNFVSAPDIALFERLMRQPGYITLRRSRTTGVRMEVYERFGRALAPDALHKPQPALLDVVTPVLRFAHRLPAYTRQTQTVSAEAQAVRYALLNAASPDQLLFDHLPRACGLEAIAADQPIEAEGTERFFEALNCAFDALKAAYPLLLEQIATAIGTAFKAGTSDVSRLHEELRQRYVTIADVLTDTELRAVGVRMQTPNVGKGWIESVAALVGKKPPETWSDDDTRLFTMRIADIGHRFRVTEQIAVMSQQIPPDTRVLRVGIADAHGERSIVIAQEQNSDEMRKLQQEIEKLIVEYDTLTNTQHTVVLAELLQRLIN